MKTFRDPIIMFFCALLLTALPILSPEQGYVLVLYGFNTHLRLEYVGWIGLAASIIWIITLLIQQKKTPEHKTEVTSE